MSMILKVFCGITLLIPVLVILIGNFFRCWYLIRCFKIKRCSNRQCKYRPYCSKYKDVLTEEDRVKIEKLIDRL